MTKISITLYYWILIIATLLFAKTAGLADNNSAIIKILIVVTILYVGVVLIVHSKGKALAEKRSRDWQKNNSADPGAKRKRNANKKLILL